MSDYFKDNFAEKEAVDFDDGLFHCLFVSKRRSDVQDRMASR